MNLPVLLAVVLSVSMAVTQLTEAAPQTTKEPLIEKIENMWRAFKSRFSKRYDNSSEEETRRQLFFSKLAIIESHNFQAGLGVKSFSLGLNEFSDWSQEEYAKYLTGYRRPSPSRTTSTVFRRRADDLLERAIDDVEQEVFRSIDYEHYKRDSFVTNNNPSNVPLPASVDWRTKGWVTPVKNQGKCGSCWSFSATGALEGQTFNKTGILTSLSEQNLIDCSNANSGCNGGVTDYAFQYVQQNGGIDTETSYPYTGQQGGCRYTNSNSQSRCSGWTDLPSGNEQALQQAVVTVGPISVAIDASSILFQMYHSGVYKNPFCSSSKLDHAVLVVGYGTYNGTPYWLVKNSWGTGWGQSGYIMIARNHKNMCGIATAASYPRY